MHPPEEWVQAVVVVVDFDAGLAGQSAGDSADVLHDPASTRDRGVVQPGPHFGETMDAEASA